MKKFNLVFLPIFWAIWGLLISEHYTNQKNSFKFNADFIELLEKTGFISRVYKNFIIV